MNSRFFNPILSIKACSSFTKGKKQFPTYYPFCLDCLYYIPMEHSPLFPNSACKYNPQLKPCTSVRSDEKSCGKEGKFYVPRFIACKSNKNE